MPTAAFSATVFAAASSSDTSTGLSFTWVETQPILADYIRQVGGTQMQ